jgi:hypothetical protein
MLKKAERALKTVEGKDGVDADLNADYVIKLLFTLLLLVHGLYISSCLVLCAWSRLLIHCSSH